MAGLDASEIYVAGTGHIYVAPEDTVVPATPPPATPWIDLGYATEDGVEFTFGKTTTPIKGWQSFDTLRMLTTEAPKSVKFALMQANLDTLQLALGGGTIDAGPPQVYHPPDPSTLDMRALYIEAVDGGETWAFWAPRVLLSDNVVIPWKKSAEAELPLIFAIQAATPDPFQFIFPDTFTSMAADVAGAPSSTRSESQEAAA